MMEVSDRRQMPIFVGVAIINDVTDLKELVFDIMSELFPFLFLEQAVCSTIGGGEPIGLQVFSISPHGFS